MSKHLYVVFPASVALLVWGTLCYGFGGIHGSDFNSDIRDAGRMSLSQDALRQARKRPGKDVSRTSKPNGAVVGTYVCKSMRGKPCDTQTELRLQAGGDWGWGASSGQYRVAHGRVEFLNGSLASWGPAAIGPATLTFAGDVVWQKPSHHASLIFGAYFCRTAPGGCQTGFPIEIKGDGAWSWGAQGGTYSILGDKIRFDGLTSGPAGWGLAKIGAGSITFGDGSGASEWGIGAAPHAGRQIPTTGQAHMPPSIDHGWKPPQTDQGYASPSIDRGWKSPRTGPGFIPPGNSR